jgi:hypothetical protein
MTSEDEERALYETLKTLDDFDCFPLPSAWYKKFNIPPRNPVTIREFMESRYTDTCFLKSTLPTLVIETPIKDGLLVQMAPLEDVPVEVISRPFTLQSVPAILPSLMDDTCSQKEVLHR